jgi:hypothetical protein
MQFTVLIEFLIPGLATTFLALALLPADVIPKFSQGIPKGDAASVLLLLAVSYPVGILTNFPAFLWIQQRLVTPMARREIVARYKAIGIDLVALCNQQFHLELAKSGSPSGEEIREIFNLMRPCVFRENVDRLNSNHLYHEGLQRFARGMFLPLLLAIALVLESQNPSWPAFVLVVIFVAFSLISVSLLVHSVRAEESQIAGFFIASTASQSNATPQRPAFPQATPAA